MKRLILAAAGLLLATANTPPSTSANVAASGELDSVVAADAPKGDHHPAAKPAKPKPPRVAVVPEPAGAYPRCSSTVRDRCVQGRSGHAGATRHARETHTRRMQLAMRAGERG
jgi:hypothetical protein